MSGSIIVRYQILPLVLGFAAQVAILLSGPSGDPSTARLLMACSMLILVPILIDVPMLYIDGKRTNKRMAKLDAAHRAATVSAFEADVERITGRPFPTTER